MQAEIIAVGSELLGASRLDTNSLFLAQQLQRLGIPVVQKHVLPDNLSALAAALAAACARSPLVITSGGLGPTEDDLTVPAAAQALEVELRPDAAAARRLHRRFRSRHLRFTRNNLQQAVRLGPAQWLANPIGSAMGQWCPTPTGVLVLLPGPPIELQRMFREQVLPRLSGLLPPAALFTRVISLVGMGESQVDAIAAPLYRRVSNPATSILVTAPQQIELHFTALAATESLARARADRLARSVAKRFGDTVFSTDGCSLATVIGNLLRQKQQTVAVAESCTGGLLGATLTDIAGASSYFLGGVLSYANAVKQDLLGVRAATLQRVGAVSTATAREMATGVRQLMGADWGLAITGIAGPDGGSRTKPVGTVFVGISGSQGQARAIRHHFSGDRERIRRSSVQLALNDLRLTLLKAPASRQPRS